MSAAPDLLPWALPPLAAATGLAAFLFVLLGLTFLALVRRDEEAGFGGLGLSALLLGAFYATETLGWHTPGQSRYAVPLWAALMVQGAALSLTVGLCRYLGEPLHWRRPAAWLLLPNGVLTVLLLAQVPVLRLGANLMTTGVLVALAGLAWRRRRGEPGAGHGLIALSLLLLPLASVVSAGLGFQPIYLRYLAVPTLLVFYLTMLPVSLLRRRRALEIEMRRRAEAERALTQLNAQLEDTVRQRTLALQDMVAGLQSFNRSVSHDLRGPLGGIEVLAQVTRQAVQRAELDRAGTLLVAIEAQARTSRDLLSALLELARVSDIPLDTAKVSLQDLVTELQDSPLPITDAAAARPEFRTGPLPEVWADARLLRIILTNLLGNARKFSASVPAPCIRVSCVQDAEQWTICVQDNGPGFDAQTAEGLFQPFHRGQAGDVAGHGVGLSIVRRAVERHGGRVWASSAAGGGASFSFSLPNPHWPAQVPGGQRPVDIAWPGAPHRRRHASTGR